MRVTAAVCFNVELDFDVPDDTDVDEIRELIFDKANFEIECNRCEPIIHDCNIEDAMD